jgi:predicted anti-sigma-YlaC factor YlaD
MSHLNLETLARLIDDTPDPTETSHLDNCQRCRDELEAMRADAAALQTLEDPEPPVAQWLRLEQRLEREGLMRRTWRWQPTMLRVAAAIVIFILGGISASLLTRSQPREYLTQNTAPNAGSVVEAGPLANPSATFAENQVESAPRVSAPAVAVAQLAPARTPEEAAARLRTAESDYLAALTRYTELAGRAAEGDPLARLAALESIVATTRAALGRAPADPVINGYHLTAVAQRDALLRQVSASGQTWY